MALHVAGVCGVEPMGRRNKCETACVWCSGGGLRGDRSVLPCSSSFAAQGARGRWAGDHDWNAQAPGYGQPFPSRFRL